MVNCFCMPFSSSYDPSVMEKVIHIQRWYKKVHLWNRVVRRVNSELVQMLYYKPGARGYHIAMKQLDRLFNKTNLD